MQLELNFNTQDLQTTSKVFFNNLHSILICMQIVSNN